jgi:hypothetical protein
VKDVAKAHGSHAYRDPAWGWLEGLQDVEHRQVHLRHIGAAPNRYAEVGDASIAQRLGQPKEILSAVEVTPRYQHPAGIMSGKLVKIGNKISPRAKTRKRLP